MMEYFVRAKFYAMRSAIYYQITQYVLIIILFLRPYHLNIWLEVAILVLVMFMAVFVGWTDRKAKVLEKEQSIANTENKELREIRDLLLKLVGQAEAKIQREASTTCNLDEVNESDKLPPHLYIRESKNGRNTCDCSDVCVSDNCGNIPNIRR
jgi:hypothetical protein